MSDLLNQYLTKWNLNNAYKIAETATGHIYKVNSEHGILVLKIFTEAGARDELAGTDFLKALDGNGAVLLYEYDNNAQLMEYLQGENLYQYSKNNKEDEATKVFVNIIKKIRNSSINEGKEKLTTMKSLFRMLDRVVPPQELSHLFIKAKELAGYLLETQTEEVLLHGDLHHENVLQNSRGEFICFDPKGMIGDPSYELGTTLKNPWNYPEISQDLEMFKRRAKMFSVELKLPLDRVIGFAFVHLCLSIAWAIEDGDSYEHQEILLKRVATLL